MRLTYSESKVCCVVLHQKLRELNIIVIAAIISGPLLLLVGRVKVKSYRAVAQIVMPLTGPSICSCAVSTAALFSKVSRSAMKSVHTTTVQEIPQTCVHPMNCFHSVPTVGPLVGVRRKIRE